MKKFYFYQDTKCVIWQRSRFAIEAESYEQALETAKKFKEVDISTSDDSELITNTEFNTESYEMLSPEENEYKATCELYNENGEMLGDNIQNCVPDDDFLFDRLISMLEIDYFPKKDGYIKEMEENAENQYIRNCRRIETLYPALKKENENGECWRERLHESVCSSYRLKLNLTTPFEAVVKRFNKYDILKKAQKNQEKPFGFVIDYLKDRYGIPKIEGWDTAEQILEYFEIDNEAPLDNII